MGTDLSTLETSLLAAKKFMSHGKLQVEGQEMPEQPTRQIESTLQNKHPKTTLTDFVSRGTKSINEPQLLTSQQMSQKQGVGQNTGNSEPKPLNMKPHSSITEEKIKSSGLPENIKNLMLENPIPDFSLNSVDRLSNDFIENVASKMKDQNYSIDGMRSTSNSQIKTPIPNEPIMENNSLGIDIPSPNPKSQTISKNKKVKKSDFKSLIKETIREALDELLEEKSKELILESKNIKDTLQIKVGKSVFYGKINKIKTASNK